MLLHTLLTILRVNCTRIKINLVLLHSLDWCAFYSCPWISLCFSNGHFSNSAHFLILHIMSKISWTWCHLGKIQQCTWSSIQSCLDWKDWILSNNISTPSFAIRPPHILNVRKMYIHAQISSLATFHISQGFNGTKNSMPPSIIAFITSERVPMLSWLYIFQWVNYHLRQGRGLGLTPKGQGPK